MKPKHLLLAAAVFGAQSVAMAEAPKNYLYIVGSTTVQPFAEAVAGKIAKSAKLKQPLFEPTGTNAGFTMFCEGGGFDSPDIINASRPIKKSEFATCQNNGAGELLEVKIGYDGIVIASDKKSKPLELTRKDLYLALDKQVPDPACQPGCDTLVANPYKTWKQVNPALPDIKIDVFGPPFSSGTMEVFAEAVSEAGCNSYPGLAAKKAKSEKEYNRICHNIREDGVYTEETLENVASKLDVSPDAVGIVTYSRLREHASHLQAAKLDGVAPSYESIANQSYPISRPLFFYVKKSHVGQVPGLLAYLNEFSSEKAMGPKGYLVAKGLVALPLLEQKGIAADVKALKPMVLDGDHRP
ncbi:MAG: substrate-binding domain-containing protein [Candidatus Methylumidiphilus sp.]